jgi:ppGpp synthetase/RelA/SpoT-type nucleotidyltranferase
MDRQWSTSDMRKLGRCIRDDEPIPSNLPTYAEVMLWYNELATSVQRRIEDEDWSGIIPGVQFEVTSRPKTIDTLRDKLQRDPNTPLQNIQDIAGVRFDAEMSLGQQTQVARRIAEMYGHDPDSTLHDLRDSAHSGYRAVHVWLRLEGRVEVQVRTHLQSEWANMYEVLADWLGRDIRYDSLPDDPELRKVVTTLQEQSTGTLSRLESARQNLMDGEDMIRRSRSVLETVSRKTRRELRYRRVQESINSTESKLASLRAEILAQESLARESMIELRAMFARARTQ